MFGGVSGAHADGASVRLFADLVLVVVGVEASTQQVTAR
jgi:uncharacterized membrane protein YtjA (UPF0391 family)